MMSTAVLILNPRDIPYCMTALHSLGYPTCWASYMFEPEAALNLNNQIQRTSYDRYTVISDDAQPTREALDLVLGLHDKYPDQCVTGYCNFDKYLPYVNLCWNKLKPPPPQMDSYRFMKRTEVTALPSETLPTSFTGLSFTTMTRDLWLRFPLHCTSSGGQMDYQLSYELQTAKIPIVAHRDAFILHHKDRFGVYPDASPEKQLLVGVRPPALTWTGVAE